MEQLDSSERLFDELSPKEKILVILASVKEPVHMDQIANFSELEEAVVRTEMESVLREEQSVIEQDGKFWIPESSQEAVFEKLKADPRAGHSKISNYYLAMLGD